MQYCQFSSSEMVPDRIISQRSGVYFSHEGGNVEARLRCSLLSFAMQCRAVTCQPVKWKSDGTDTVLMCAKK